MIEIGVFPDHGAAAYQRMLAYVCHQVPGTIRYLISTVSRLGVCLPGRPRWSWQER